MRALRGAFPALDPALLARLARAYGTAAFQVLEGVTEEDEFGDWFGAHLCAREVDYLMDREWALTAAGVLWRRSKLGLRVSDAERSRLARFMAEQQGLSAAG